MTGRSSYRSGRGVGQPSRRDALARRPDQEDKIETRSDARPIFEAFGLSFRSAIPLPELAGRTALEPVTAGGRADVEILLGTVADRLEGGVDLEPLMQVAGDRFQLNAPAGRYRLEGGRRIVAEPRPGVSARDVRLYLLGTVMGALCHQRSRLALHATALELDDGAVIVAGPSGAGKSTLAARHLRAGGGVLADDLCVVTLDPDGAPRAHRGLQRIKLWGDALALSGWADADPARIADDIDKYSLPVPRGAASRLLRRIYILRPGEAAAPVIRPISGPEAAAALVSQVFRWPLAAAMGQAPALFAQCVALAGRCPIHEVRFAHDASAPLRLFDALVRNGADS